MGSCPPGWLAAGAERASASSGPVGGSCGEVAAVCAALWACATCWDSHRSRPRRSSRVGASQAVRTRVAALRAATGGGRAAGPDRPDPPSLLDWESGGIAWALATGTMPCPLLLTRLAALYGYPHTEGVDRLRDGARRTLAVLALAQDPAGASTGELLAELEGLLEYLLSVIGQLRGRVQDAQHRLVDELVGRLPETAHVPAVRPAPTPTGPSTPTPGADTMGPARHSSRGASSPPSVLSPAPPGDADRAGRWAAVPGFPAAPPDLHAAARCCSCSFSCRRRRRTSAGSTPSTSRPSSSNCSACSSDASVSCRRNRCSAPSPARATHPNSHPPSQPPPPPGAGGSDRGLAGRSRDPGPPRPRPPSRQGGDDGRQYLPPGLVHGERQALTGRGQ